MPSISSILQHLESYAPPAFQESYDNSGLITGDKQAECTGILCTLDATEAVVDEAHRKGANLIVAHHPILFRGIKSIKPDNYVGRTLIRAIKEDIAIYAIHTNLDNVLQGVSGKMAAKLGLSRVKILSPAAGTLSKLYTFVPEAQLETVRAALFAAGAGVIGNYSECGFSVSGEGTFKAGSGADPYVGSVGSRHSEKEARLEMIFPTHLSGVLTDTLKKVHPYEEVAYDIVALSNRHPEVGSGAIGEFDQPMPVDDFLRLVSRQFRIPVIRHTSTEKTLISRVAVCGGAGNFLIHNALAAKADAYITADIKYHEFFDGEEKMMICDIGHYESEQFTIELLHDLLVKKFPTFAVLKSEVETSPVRYFIS